MAKAAQQQTPLTGNQRISATEVLTSVLGGLDRRREEIEAVLPNDISYERFHATVNQALRNNVDILQCTGASIINACIKAAYDGLRVDGREAALVSHNVKVQSNPDRYEKRAQYFPMVFGLVQQVLRGGEVIAIEATIIYANEPHRIVRGSTPFVEHEPLLTGDRGEPIAAYSVATLKSGFVSTHIMRKDEIENIRAASKSGEKNGEPIGIWKRWWQAMWLKTVIRQHRKTLPLGGREIRDEEAREIFPQFAGSDRTALPAPTPRPTRAAPALTQSENGVSLDLPLVDDREHAVIDGQSNEAKPAPKAAAKAKAEPEPAVTDMPQDETEWDIWGVEVRGKADQAADAAAVNTLWTDEKDRIAAAPELLREEVVAHLTDRLADLATDTGPAADAGEESTTSAETTA